MAKLTKAEQEFLAKKKAASQEKSTAKATKKKQDKAAVTKEQLLEQIKQAGERKASKDAETRNILENGDVSANELGGDTLGFGNPSSQLSSNYNYHKAFLALHNDLSFRVQGIQDDLRDSATKKAKEAAAKQSEELGRKVDVDNLVNEKGERISFIDTRVQKNIDPINYHLSAAYKKYSDSVEAHKAGKALSSVQHLTDASDHLAAAINLFKNNFSTQKYGKIAKFKGDKTFNINNDSDNLLNNIVNGYTDHAFERATASGDLKPSVAEKARTILSQSEGSGQIRQYGQITAPQEKLAVPQYAVTQTREEKAEAAKQAEEKRQKRLSSIRMTKAQLGQINIVKPATDTSGVEGFIGTSGYDSEEYQKNFNLRWKSEQIMPAFQKDEERTANSAAEVGKQYEPKTFVGSLAHQNPDEWHKLKQVKDHWVSKGNRPEDFEGSSGHIDPDSYIKENKLDVSEITPSMDTIKKWARLTTSIDSSGKVVNMEGFVPTAAETARANTQEKLAKPGEWVGVPEDINRRQAARASRGVVEIKASRSSEFLKTADSSKLGSDMEQEPEATASDVLKTEQEKIINKPVTDTGVVTGGLNSHFDTGRGV